MIHLYNEKGGFLAGWMQTVIFYPAFLALWIFFYYLYFILSRYGHYNLKN